MSQGDGRSSSPEAGAQAPARGSAERPRRGLHAEYGVSAFLAALGALVLVESTQITADVSGRGPVGPRAFPVVIGIALVVLAVVHALDVARGGRGEAEGGEDVEDVDAPADWRTLALLVAGFVANIVLIEPLGWPLSGALLFFVVAYALGSRHVIRDVAISLVLGFLSYYLFADLLGIVLPEGVLSGVL